MKHRIGNPFKFGASSFPRMQNNNRQLNSRSIMRTFFDSSRNRTIGQFASTTPNGLALPPPGCRLLVIGYGNELRGDDAAGPLVAHSIADSKYASVRVMTEPCLRPEIVVDMAEAERVLFVDASLRRRDGRIRLGSVKAAPLRPVLSCAFPPGMIVAIGELFHGKATKSWLLEIPASRFEFGYSLSDATASGIEQAIGLIHRWIVAIAQTNSKQPKRQCACHTPTLEAVRI